LTHAFLSPSGAKLDLHCPGNRHMQAKVERSSTEHSALGTGLHALGAACLLRDHNTDRYIGWWCGENAVGADYLIQDKPDAAGTKGFWAFQIKAEHAQNVQIYINHVREVRASMPGSISGVEKKVVISDDCWGTADSSELQPFGICHVSDYKNGFTFVGAGTPQLKLYLIGEVGVLNPYEIQTCIATIVQPNAKGAEIVRSVSYTWMELISWYMDIYLPAATACLDEGAVLCAGDWCKDGWCDARHMCPALLALGDEIAQGMFTDTTTAVAVPMPAPVDMTPDVYHRILEFGPAVADMIKKVQEHEYALAMKGENSWGKLVTGRNSRSWADPEVANQRLSVLLHGEQFNRNLKSPAQVEEALKGMGHKPKAAKEHIVDLIKTTAGKPKLVHRNAKGKAYDPVGSMFGNTESVV